MAPSLRLAISLDKKEHNCESRTVYRPDLDTTSFPATCLSRLGGPGAKQLRQLQEELKALRKDVTELNRESRSRMPMRQRIGPGTMSGRMMQPMKDMIQGCMQMMGNNG